MAPILTLFSTTLASLVALIKKLLHKYNFRALSAYESLLNYQSHWDDLLARRGPESRKDSNELKDGLHTLRAVCLRSFPEFLADLKFGAMGKGGEFLVTTGLVDFAISVRSHRCLIKLMSKDSVDNRIHGKLASGPNRGWLSAGNFGRW
jgi:exocyst complex protein 7